MTNGPTYNRGERWIWIGIGLLITLWALRPIWDMDIWWHIALGRLIAENGLPHMDPLALGREGVAWATFQGGYEWFMASIENAWGLLGVRWVHALAIGAGMALFGFSISRLTRSRIIAFGAVLLLLFLYEDRIRVRPHVFHFLAMSWMLSCLSRPRFRWVYRDLFHMIPVMFIWSTFHGPASLWGLLLIGCGTIAHPRHRESWLCMGAAILTVVVSPGVLTGLISSFGVHTRPGIQARFVPEHGSLLQYLNEGSIRGFLIVALTIGIIIAATGAIAFTIKQKKDFPKGLALGGLAMGIFAMLFARFSWYSMGPLLLALPLMGPSKPQLKNAFLVLTFLLFSWDASQYVLPRYAQQEEHPWVQDIQTGHPHHFPQHAARFLAKAGIGGNIYNEVGWGGYLLYALQPGTRTLYDSRIAFVDEAAQLLVEDDQVMLEKMQNMRNSNPEIRNQAVLVFQQKREAIAERAAALGANLIVKRSSVFGKNATSQRSTQEWKLLYGDSLAEVWARKDSLLESRVEKVRQAWGDAGVQRKPD